MEINTNKMVETLKNDQPLSITMVQDKGKDKLLCLFALPHLSGKIIAFAKELLKQERPNNG